jgi:hypothetical protein
LEAWENKQKRDQFRIAEIQLVIAQGAGMKIKGRPVRITDFLPDWAKPDSQELLMAEVAKALRKQNG